MKKLINQPANVVEEMLQGLCVLQPGLIRLAGNKVMLRSDVEQVRDRQVAVISGGGSGHEPAHAGYIGTGMLSAAVAGEVFTSPGSDSVLAAIRAVSGKQGALLVVKNYTGDRLNFGVAAEMARAEGIPVEMIIVSDDVALKDTDTATGPRGLAGTVFLHKLVGAAAEEGKTLTEIAAIGRAAIQSLATMGLSFSAGTSPSVGKPSFELAENEMELGLGIHGEAGVKRMPIRAGDELTEMLLSEIVKHGRFDPAKPVAIMINNLGATTEMELAIVARHAIPFLQSKGFIVERVYAGTFLSSLDMAGISISLLGLNDEWLRWLDAETSAPAWPKGPKQPPRKPEDQIATGISFEPAPSSNRGAQTETGRRAWRSIDFACKALIDAEEELTEMDRVTGDGDLGTSMKRAAEAVLASENSYPLDDVPATLKQLGRTLQRVMGGSSGPLYGALLLRCGIVLESSGSTELAGWIEALHQGCLAISEMGGAKRGDRTMLDALIPFVESLDNAREGEFPAVLLSALEAAERGADATAQMTPRVGRSSYLGDRAIGHPDPGAKAVAIWLRGVGKGLLS
ncbi:MAG TPA: dihydroxyacetone kinase subunit DhaL [Edaphobacter sp.]|nr:dihydroxyacetone kinase subunit DhaL [Edaphobacter sp.]